MLELGFVTAIFADDDFETVLDFASNNGFACLEVMCWPKGLAERRYAGVTHIDVDHLDDAQVKEINELLKEKGVYISGLGYYPNPLDPDHEKRDFYFGHIKKVITAAARLGVPVVNTFIGRDPRLNLQENLEQFKAYWPPIIAHAEQQGVKIGIVNCPMLFTYDEWPGGKNLAISPAIWEQMFEIIPSAHFGLNYDPSHMIWQQMDYLKPLLEFKHKLFHIHLKDAKLFKDKLDRVGIMATPLEYHSPKLPGLGDVDWKKFLNGVRESGYAGPVVIEFEDKMYETCREKIVEGMLKTRSFLLPLL
ncbi:MAG: sugar phosphate isomerase/epimerase family protein [Sphingobacteriales bacterium]